jgi:methyl-accepting chemotaxis protein
MAIGKVSLRGRFALWTGTVVVVSTLALTGTVYSISSQALTQQADQEMDRVVASTAGALDLWIASRERDALNLSELETLVTACTDRKLAEAQQTLLYIQGRSPFYENVFLADANGREFLDTVGGKSVGFDLSAHEGFLPNVEHARRGEVWMGEGMRSPATGRAVALLTAPILAGGRLVGILGTPIGLSDFSDAFVKDKHIAETGYLYMIDGSGMLLAHPDIKKIMDPKLPKMPFQDELLAKDAGSLRYDYEGTTKTAHFQRSARKKWTIVATAPISELMAPVRKIQFYLVLFGLGTLGGTVLAVMLIAGKLSRSIGYIVSDLSGSAEQFLSASTQMAQTSQTVAQGASENAASIQDAALSAQKVTGVAQENKQRTSTLAGVMREAGASFQVMDQSIERLVQWMKESRHSSEKVSKIIGAIDEIAFQTNILALNAAVEAARAGEAGMGFAVVADEVRNLARRSAEAARDTSALIQESIQKTAEGQTTMDQCAQAIAENSQLSKRVVQLIGEVEGATAEQVRDIDAISQAVLRMEQSTQETAASAEQSASASEELKAQSEAVDAAVSQLRDLVQI